MFKDWSVGVALMLVTGCISGYLAMYFVRDDMRAIAAPVRTELQALSTQISTFRHPYTSPPQQETPSHYATGTSQPLREEMASLVREVLQKELEPMLADLRQRDNSSVSQSIPPRDPELIRSGVEEADAVLEFAKNKGVWDESSAQAFDQALQKLSGKEWDEAKSKLATAINNGEITVDPAALMQY